MTVDAGRFMNQAFHGVEAPHPALRATLSRGGRAQATASSTKRDRDEPCHFDFGGGTRSQRPLPAGEAPRSGGEGLPLRHREGGK